jgi:hypothetical protein
LAWALEIQQSLEGRIKDNPTTMTEEYLTISEIAARLKVKPKTVKNKMASGIFQRGVHFFSPKGLGPRFKWSAIVTWLEGEEEQRVSRASGAIPMARNYFLGDGQDFS